MISSILSKMTLIYCLSLAKVADILDFTHNAMIHVVAYHTTMSGIPENIMIDTKVISNMSKNDTDWLFNLGKVATILDVTHNAKPELLFGHTTMSGIPENPMVHTKIMRVYAVSLFSRRRKDYLIIPKALSLIMLKPTLDRWLLWHKVYTKYLKTSSNHHLRTILRGTAHQQTRDVDPMLSQCWPSVADDGLFVFEGRYRGSAWYARRMLI